MTDPVSFRQCLVHETKKAYKAYLKAAGIVLGCGLILFVLFLLYVTCRDAVWTFGSNTVGFLGSVWSALSSGIWFILSSIPWWVYLIILVASPPLLYAAGVCIQRRWKIDIVWCCLAPIFAYILSAVVCFGMTGFASLIDAAVIHSSELSLNWPVFYITTLIAGTLILLILTGKNPNGTYAWKLKPLEATPETEYEEEP